MRTSDSLLLRGFFMRHAADPTRPSLASRPASKALLALLMSLVLILGGSSSFAAIEEGTSAEDESAIAQSEHVDEAEDGTETDEVDGAEEPARPDEDVTNEDDAVEDDEVGTEDDEPANEDDGEAKREDSNNGDGGESLTSNEDEDATADR